MYCPRCKQIVDAPKCPDCKKPTREPEDGDLCLLAEKPLPIAGMLKDVLAQNGIQTMQMGVLGAGLSTLLGSNIEYTRLYTTFADRPAALEITDEIFGAPIDPTEDADETEGEEISGTQTDT